MHEELDIPSREELRSIFLVLKRHVCRISEIPNVCANPSVDFTPNDMWGTSVLALLKPLYENGLRAVPVLLPAKPQERNLHPFLSQMAIRGLGIPRLCRPTNRQDMRLRRRSHRWLRENIRKLSRGLRAMYTAANSEVSFIESLSFLVATVIFSRLELSCGPYAFSFLLSLFVRSLLMQQPLKNA